MRRLFIGLLFILSCVSKRVEKAHNDIIYLKSGEEITGTLKRIEKGEVVIRTTRGEERFSTDEIMSIGLSKSRPGDEWRKIRDITDTLLLRVIREAPSKDDYPNSNYINLYIEKRYSFLPSGELEERRRVIRKILTQSGKRVANQWVSYMAGKDNCEIVFARSILPDSSVIHIKDAAIEDVSRYPRFPAYDRLRLKKFALPEAQVGAILDYEIKILHKSPPFIIDEVIGGREPILEEIVKVALYRTIKTKSFRKGFPKPISIHGAPRRFEKSIIKPQEFVYIFRDIPAIEQEPNLPPTREILPRLVEAEEKSWEEVDAKYLKILQDSLIGIKPLADSLTQGIDSPLEKAKRLYNFVLHQIRYIPVDISQYSYIPKSTLTILNERQGNDLDKPYLLYGLLRSVGLDAKLALLPTQDRGPLIEFVPSLGSFNAALVVIDDTLFLDPTQEEYPFGYIRTGLRGVRGLLIGSSGRIIKVPLQTLKGDGTKSTIKARLNRDGTLEVEEKKEFEGDKAVSIRRFRNLKPEEQRIELEKLVSQIHPEAKLLDYSFSDLKDLSKPVWMRLYYRIENYALKGGKKFLTFPLPEIYYSASKVAREKRRYPIAFPAPEFQSHNIIIKLPRGYLIHYIPEKYEAKGKGIEYKAVFSKKGNRIIFNDYYTRETIRIPPEVYSQYRECLQTMAKLPQELIILKRR